MAERTFPDSPATPTLRLTVGRLFLTLAGSHEDETEETFADAEAMADTLAFVAALIVEFDPALDNPQRLRMGSEEFGRRVHRFAKAIRSETARTGEPVVMRFGGLRAIPRVDSMAPLARA